MIQACKEANFDPIYTYCVVKIGLATHFERKIATTLAVSLLLICERFLYSILAVFVGNATFSVVGSSIGYMLA